MALCTDKMCEIEQASFTPAVLSTTGSCMPLYVIPTNILHNRTAQSDHGVGGGFAIVYAYIIVHIWLLSMVIRMVPSYTEKNIPLPPSIELTVRDSKIPMSI